MSNRRIRVGVCALFLGLPAVATAQVVNADFAAGLDGWTPSEHGGGTFVGEVFAQDEEAVLLGGDSFLVGLEQTFVVPALARSLSFDVFPEPGWDGDDVFVPDAFEVRLLDADGATWVPPWTAGSTAFFNWQPDGTAHEALGVQFDGVTVTVDVSDVPAGQSATLVFSLIGGNRTVTSGLTVDGVRVVLGNRVPLADAGEDATLECGTEAARLDGGGSLDPDGDTLSYVWTNDADVQVGTTVVVELPTVLGMQTYTLAVSDGFGGTATDEVTISLVDTEPPVFSGVPAHVDVEVGASCVGTIPDLRTAGEAIDACAGALAVTQTPVHGTLGTGPGTVAGVELRAEDPEGQAATRAVEVRFVDSDGSCGVVVDTDTDGDTDTDVVVVDTDTDADTDADSDAAGDTDDSDAAVDTDPTVDTDTDDGAPSDGGAGDDSDDDWDPQCGCDTRGRPEGWLVLAVLAGATLLGRRRARRAGVSLAAALTLTAASAARAAEDDVSIELGAQVDGSVPAGGAVQRYTFTVDEGDAVYVQAVATSAYFDTTWRLVDRWDRVLASAGDFVTLGKRRLMGGEYAVEVWNTAGAACTFSFRVSGSAEEDRGEVSPGDVIDAVFTTPAERHTYTLVLPSDQTLFFDASASGSMYLDTSWTLIDPHGNKLVDALDLYDIASLPLHAGRYALTFEGTAAATGAYRMALATPDTDAASLALGALASGGLTSPGDVDRWTFTLDEPTRVSVDVRAASNYFGTQWSLRDAAGLAVVEAVDMYDLGPLALASGAYTIEVVGEGAGVGTYQLQVDPVTDPSGVLTLGSPTTIPFDVMGEVGTYTFTLDDDADVVVTAAAVTGGSVWDYNLSVRDGDGVVLVAPIAPTTPLAPTALAAGTYTLVVDPTASAVGTLSVRVDVVTETTQAMSIGDTLTGAVTVPWGADRYTFTAAPGDIVDLQYVTAASAGALGWRLTDSAGRDVVAQTGDLFHRNGVALAGGAYTLEIRSHRGGTSSYSVRVEAAGSSTWIPSGTPVTLGTPVSAVIATPAGSADWRFDLPARTDVFVELDTGAGWLFWTLFDAVGRPVFGPSEASNTAFHHHGPLSLAAGSYTLRVFASSGTPAYGFTVQEVPPQVSDTLDVGVPVSGVFTSPGELHAWAFDVTATTEVYVDLLTGGTRLYWSLLDPEGNTHVARRAAQHTYWDDLEPLRLSPGTWTLVLDPEVNVTPSYQLVVRETADVALTGVIGETQAGAVTAPGSTVTWTFDVATATEVMFDLRSQTPGTARWTLVGPTGHTRWDAVPASQPYWDDRGPILLTPGTWSLTFDPERDVLSSTTFALVPVLEVTRDVDLDEVVAGSFADSADVHAYVLSLTAPTRVYFDNRLAVAGLAARLVDELGRLVLERELSGVQQDGGAWTLPAGDYTLTLSQRGGGLTSYAFAFVTVADVSRTLAFGDVWLDTPEIGADARGTFEVVEDGTPVQVDLVEGAFDANLSVTDPQGMLVYGPVRMLDTSADMSATRLAPGTYVILVDPIADNTSPYELELRTGHVDDPRFYYTRYSGHPNVKGASFAYQGTFDLHLVSSIASTSGADGVVMAPDGDLLVGGGALFHKVNPATGAIQSVGLGGGAAYHIALDPTGVKAWTSSMPGELVEVPLVPFGAGVVHQVEGDDGVITHLAFDRQGRAFYTASGSGGHGSFGTIDMTTYRTTRAHTALPAAHGMAFDPFTDTLILTGATHITQIDPNTLEILSDLTVPGVQFDQGTVDGAGHAYVADNGGDLVFVDYSATGRVGDAANYVYHDFLDAYLDDVAPMSWLGSPCAGAPPILDVSPAPGSAFAPGTTITVSGRVLSLDPTRPPAAILVNDAPVDALDAAGRFFRAHTIQPGANVLRIDAHDRCGVGTYTLTLSGDVDASGTPSTLTEVSALLDAQFTDTTFGTDANRLLVTVRAKNVSTDRVAGPLFLAIGADLPADMRLENVEGVTPDGLSYVAMMGAGSLAPGEVSSSRPLSFLTPRRERVLFTPRFFTTGNHAPVFTSIPYPTARVGRTWRHQARATDPDGQALTFKLEVGPVGAVFDAGTGTLTWTPTAGDVGVHEVVVSVHDGFGGRARQLFSLEVAPLDASVPPMFVSIPVTQASVGAAYRYDADALDPDGDTLAYTVVTGPAGLVVDGASGVVTWPLAVPGDHEVELRVVDGRGGEAVQGYSLSAGVLSRNPSGPQITSAPPTMVPVAGLYLYQPVAFDPDGDVLAWTLDEAPDGMVLDAVTGRLLWTPVQAQGGEHAIAVSVSDGRGGTATQRWRVGVFDGVPNRAPVFTSVPGSAAVVGVPFRYVARALDPELGPVSYARATGPVDVAITSGGELTWTPGAADVGVVAVGVRATDTLGAAATQVFLVEVRAANAPPQLVGSAPDTAWVGERWSFDAGVVDVDGDAVTFSLVEAPAGMGVDARLGLVSWLPGAGDLGSHTVTLAAEDAFGGMDQLSFVLSVVDDVTPPVVAVSSPASVCLGETARVCVGASDEVSVASRTLLVDDDLVVLDALGCAPVDGEVVGARALRATAVDRAANQGEALFELVVVDCHDAETPSVALLSPVSMVDVTEPVEIVGRIDDNQPATLSWRVEISAHGADAWTTLETGSGAADGALATLDPTQLPTGDLDVRLYATDGPNWHVEQITVAIGGALKLGNFALSFTDMTFDLAGIPLHIERGYSTLEVGAPTDLAPGWRIGLSGFVVDTPLELDPGVDPFIASMSTPTMQSGDRVTVMRPDGRRVAFRFEPQVIGALLPFGAYPHFEPEPGVTDTLEPEGAAIVMNFGTGWRNYFLSYNPTRYVLTTVAGVRYTLDEQAGLVKVEDAYGNTVDVRPDGLVHSAGAEVAFTRDASSRITEITGPDALPDGTRVSPWVLRYRYDAAGNLVGVTGASGHEVTMSYAGGDHPHHLVSVVDPLGNPVVRTVYDADGRLAAQCGAGGDLDTLEGCTTFAHILADRVSTTFDARGHRIDEVFDARGNVLVERRWLDGETSSDTTAVYDDEDRVVSLASEGHVWNWAYDARGRMTSATDPDGRVTTWTYGLCLGPLTATSARGDTRRWTYDDYCGAQTAVDATGGVTRFDSDFRGDIREITRPDGAVWAWEYDSWGRATRVTAPSGADTAYTYGDGGAITTVATDADGTVVREYDAGFRLALERWPGGEETVYTYDIAGKLTDVVDPDTAVALSWTPMGSVEALTTTVDGATPVTVSYTYDANGNVATVADSLGAATTLAWDALSRPVRATQAGSGTATKRVDLAYDGLSRLSGVTRWRDADGTLAAGSTAYTYESAAVLRSLGGITHRSAAGGVVHALTLARDPLGVVTALDDAEGGHAYVVDGESRLLSAEHEGGTLPAETYAWDAGGRRTSSHLSALHTYASAAGTSPEWLVGDDTYTYTYDEAGRVTERRHRTDGTHTTWAWDARGQLVRHTEHAAGGAVSRDVAYLYDGLGRRVGSRTGASTVVVVYDRANPILELDDAGAVLVRRFYGEGMDQLFAEQSAAGTRWALTDAVGSVRDWAGDDGVPVAHLVYDSFGRVLAGGVSTTWSTLAFGARPTDLATGVVDLRARPYDTRSGRFLAPDPLAPFGYEYAGSSPLSYVDATGESVAVEYACLASKAAADAWAFGSTIGMSTYQLLSGVRDAVISLQPPPGNLAQGAAAGVAAYASQLTGMPTELTDAATKANELRSQLKCVDNGAAGAAAAAQGAANNPPPAIYTWTGPSWSK